MELNLEWELLVPEYILAGWAGVVVLLDLFWGRLRKDQLAYVAAAGALASSLSALLWVNDDTDFAGLIDVDNYTALFRVFFGGIGVFACVASARFVRDRLLHAGEYYALILLSVLGANLMAAAGELLTAYISLELLSFSLYVLTSYAKFDLRSNEGGLKYMLLGAFSSAIFLYGISMIYGVSGSTRFTEIAAALSGDTSDFGMAMFLGSGGGRWS